jgi:predicted RNA-binding Zn-ribbon protein involved in translation (DUF1610 family)
MRDEPEPLDCPSCPTELIEYEREFRCPNCDHVIVKSEPSAVDPCDIWEKRI